MSRREDPSLDRPSLRAAGRATSSLPLISFSSGIELAALGDESQVDLPAGWGIRMAVDRSFAAAGITRTVTYEVNDTAAMVEFIRNGLAIGMLPRSLVDTTGPGEIAFVRIRHHPPEFQTASASPANRRLSAAAQAMLETIKRHTFRGGKPGTQVEDPGAGAGGPMGIWGHMDPKSPSNPRQP